MTSASQNPARTPAFGAIADVSKKLPANTSLEIFRRTAYCRHFEIAVAQAFQQKHIRIPIYLSAGQEQIAAALSVALPHSMIFAQHRAHSYYLSYGGDPCALVDELLGRKTGCAGGQGGSASIFDLKIGMYGHSGLMGDQVPIAVGAAIASNRLTLTVTGDASVEEDYVFGAMGFAITKKAPVLFVCEDNDLSILTHVAVRRSWNMTDVARSLGMPAADISDDPWLVAHHVAAMRESLPAFINIRTCRQLWHAGAGCDGASEWNRYELMQQEMDRLGLREQRLVIESQTQSAVKQLWDEQLQKR